METGKAGDTYASVRILGNPFHVDGAFCYLVPPALRDDVRRGTFVTVPFGKGDRLRLALVTDLRGADDPDGGRPDLPLIKPIGGVCRRSLSLSEAQLALCAYLRERTLCATGEAVRAILPAAALASLRETYRPVGEADPPEGTLSPSDLRVCAYVRARGAAQRQAVRARFGAEGTEALDRLCERGLVRRELVLREPTVPTVTRYALNVPRGEAEAAVRGDKGAVPVRSERQKAVLRALSDAGRSLETDELRQATGADAAQLRALVRKGLVSASAEAAPLCPAGGGDPGVREPYALSEEQAEAVRVLEGLAGSGEPKAALLYGVTGSGKTCVILEMIDRMIDAGRGVIVLLPEISLTPQMLAIFGARYGSRVAVLHSGLSAGERLASYRRLAAGDATVAVGTRSAVFAPVRRLGMIVMDEEQEHTYKSDMNPKYHARDVARFRCAAERALLLLSSATPSLESYRKAETGAYTLVTMRRRYGSARLPRVEVADMRREPAAGNLSPIGTRLLEEMVRVHSEGNQSVLFLNRRGYSHQIVCRSCGRAILCPRCSVAMNYHARPGRPDDGEMVCHWCGARRPAPAVCPDCGSPHLFRMGYGTQRVEEELRALLPGASVLRMDADTTTTKSAYRDLLGRFRRREGDVLLGTQMVTKGHDFPDVTLVGVLTADAALYFDDYRAAERTFALLTQVIGRAGRADKEGLAVIQTMNPDSDVIRLACAQDYETFYQREIRLRRLLQFPPFCDMALLTLTCPDEAELWKASERLSEALRELCGGAYADVPILSFGPFEAPVYRVDNVFRTRMVVKCRLNRRSRALFAELLVRFPPVSRNRRKPVLSLDLNPSSI